MQTTISCGKEFHSSIMHGERNCFLSIALNLPPASFISCSWIFELGDKTTVISIKHLKDSHLFSRLRNHNLIIFSFSKYGKCSRPVIILHLFLFYFILFLRCKWWPELQAVFRMWGQYRFISRVWDFLSTKLLSYITLVLEEPGRWECT